MATLPLPPLGHYYHGVFPGGRSGEEDDITLADIEPYENAAGKSVAWVYFSHNWYNGRDFPRDIAEGIRHAGSVPYIRLMLRSSLQYDGAEPLFPLQNILDGSFDDDLRAWCDAARHFGSPIVAEYGTEVNSDSFAWSGIANGAGTLGAYGDPAQPDGPERFKDAYRRVIRICRDAGARNITWVFHVDSQNHPDEDWNQIEHYYPGDEWIDWLGISIYSAHRPRDRYWDDFHLHMDDIYARLTALAPAKPIIIAEFGAPANNPRGDQAEWARAALGDIAARRYPNLIGFAWWNERWENDSNPSHDTNMRLEDNPDLAQVFRELVGNNQNVLGKFFP